MEERRKGRKRTEETGYITLPSPNKFLVTALVFNVDRPKTGSVLCDTRILRILVCRELSTAWHRLSAAVAAMLLHAAAAAIASSWDYLLLLHRDNYSASLTDCLLGDFVT